jgi:mono/diheme cytochrome c family protein
MGLKLPVLLAVAGILVLLRFARAGMLAWALAWWVGIYVGLRLGFVTPIPGSVIKLYMGIVTVALFAYVTSSAERREGALRPILRLVLEPHLRLPLAGIVLALPLLVALNVYVKMSVPLEAPAFGRTIHPAPPDAITVHDRDVDLIHAVNPYRELERTDAEAFGRHVANGRQIYFRNCFFCHGDAAAGDGLFAARLNPIPSNFTDSGVLPMLQESFLFWRIAKGGPGLPEEGGPWDSAMPAWEKFLTEEEIWDVILFLYDYTGFRPRAREAHE